MNLFNRLSVLATLLLLLLMVAAGQVVYAATYTPMAVGMADAEATDATELLVLGINGAITVSARGFPRDEPPKPAANGNWFTPVNFAEGTFYYRVQIRNQPVPQNMKLQFCAWQDQFVLESCGSINDVRGNSGTVVTWSQPVDEIWKKNNVGVDWRRPRQRYAIAIKNAQGLPVSNYLGWNWNGENPAHWYPLDACMTVVVVAKGATFSGWQNYGCGGGGNPTATPTPPPLTPTRTPTPTTPQPTPTPTPGNPCTPLPNNLIQNASFENNLRSWRFQSKSIGAWNTVSSAYECTKALQIQIDQRATTTQLYQNGLNLEANARYRLSFAAYSTRGQDLGVYLHKHGAPYTNYGLTVHQVNLQPGWQLYQVEFNTRGFAGTVTDARLRFWLAPFAQPGDQYWIDAVSLVKLTGPTAMAEEPGVVTLPDLSLLIGLTEAEFDPSVVDMLDDGNVVDEEADDEEGTDEEAVDEATQLNQIFLPAVMN